MLSLQVVDHASDDVRELRHFSRKNFPERVSIDDAVVVAEDIA
jgi:hypothetical protein